MLINEANESINLKQLFELFNNLANNAPCLVNSSEIRWAVSMQLTLVISFQHSFNSCNVNSKKFFTDNVYKMYVFIQ